jgi:hypothetical protein
MKFLALIYADESLWAEATQEEFAASMAAHNAFSEANASAIAGGEALEPTAAATTVRVRDGERILTDGPFAETKEQLGGFYVIEAADLDAALAVAAQIPEAQLGGVEVRPIVDFEGMEG